MRVQQRMTKSATRRRTVTNARQSIREIANGHIVRNYPFGCLGGDPRRLVGKNGMWIVPIIWTSPGFGAVGEVGLVALAAKSQEIVSATPRREVTAAMKQLREAQADALQTAFHRARTV